MSGIAKTKVIVALAGIDLVVVLSSAALVAEQSRRWPLLLVVGPLLLIINALGLYRMNRETNGRSPLLPAIYSCGILGGTYWTLEDFHWWKCISLAVALLLLISTLIRQNTTRAASS